MFRLRSRLRRLLDAAAASLRTDADAGTAAAPPLAPPLPVAPVARHRPGRLLDLGEDAARRRFLDHYARMMGLDGPPSSWGAESQLDPVDWAEILVPSHLGT